MKKTIMTVAASLAVVLSGCNDTWDDHYSENPVQVADATVMEELRENPELSTFAKMVEIAGYADLLNSSQTFTVFAPENADLSGIDLSDEAAVARTVANHVARFNISSSTGADEGVKMLNGKLMYFTNGGTAFGGVDIVKSDVIGKNGVLHILKSQIPYAYNFREYLDTHAETSDIAAFLARFDEMLYPSQLPEELYNQNKSSYSDSVKVKYNRLLDYPGLGLGAIGSEDSLFSMIIPDNSAWRAAYEEIKPYFKVYNADQAVADSIQDVQTSLAIVNDLIFRTGYSDPMTLDSIVSTSGSAIYGPAAFLEGMREMTASNGRLYLASRLNYRKEETYCKPILLEAENQTGRTADPGTTVYTRTVDTDSPYAPYISGQRYIEVLPPSASRGPGITFSIPQVLAGSYDIYMTFVPASAADATVTNDSTRVQFMLSYCDVTGPVKRPVTFKDKSFVTSGTRMVTIKVAEAFKFPVSNYYDNLWYMANDVNDMVTTTTINVSPNITTTEQRNNVFTRKFRIDRIQFVPVQDL